MFIDAQQFPFLQDLKREWKTIRDECLAIDPDIFEPWVQREMYGDGWSVFGLHAFGQRIEPALRACPRTATLLEGIPGLTTAGFSRLAPGTHIQPHVGWVTTVFRAHLGLVIPEECGIRVGPEVRPWREGECLVFDDTTEHEAWNRSDKVRTVLLFDFLRPGQSPHRTDTLPADVREFVRKFLR